MSARRMVARSVWAWRVRLRHSRRRISSLRKPRRSPIIQIDQAALNRTLAQIAAAGAMYEPLSRHACPDFATGPLG
jgi:hypothetical protein